MMQEIQFGLWDAILVVAVAVHATSIAYVHSSRWKALLYALPVPFTLASLALGTPIGVTHVLGLLLTFLFLHAVRWGRDLAHLPIVVSIVLSALAYCLAGGWLAAHVPATDGTFWGALVSCFVVATFLHIRLPHRTEPGHRSPLPVPLKFGIVVLVVCGLVILKQYLQGFMTFFPMVGVVATYESRHSLWTMARQIPAFMIAMSGAMAIIYLTQDRWGLGLAMVAGWMGFLGILIPLTRRMWVVREVQSVVMQA